MVSAQNWNEVSEGQVFTLTEPMDSQRLVIWAAASGDFYQIHYDDDFAKGNNLPDIIVHGALKGMLVGRLLDEICGDSGRITNFGVSYRGMDPARQDLTVHATVIKKYEENGEHLLDLEVGVKQEDGSTETTPGTATIAIPTN
jgi:acyl dehydratase|tara:strand:- start:252 stop:680 length:429 start_codon:yes stop_codon:yes gene_type:complete